MSAEVKAVETPKTAVDGFELPSGYLDEQGNVHKSVHLREITGEEEDILASKKLAVHKRLQRVLERCITQIDGVEDAKKNDAIKNLPLMDRYALLIRLRTISLGNDYTFETECTNESCQKVLRQFVELDSIVVHGMREPKTRVFSETLPKTGQAARWSVMTGTGEDKLSGLEQHKDSLSLMILARLQELGGEIPNLGMIKALPMADRDYLRGRFMEEEGSMDDEVDVECSHCGNEFKTEIEIGQAGFFFPAGTSKR